MGSNAGSTNYSGTLAHPPRRGLVKRRIKKMADEEPEHDEEEQKEIIERQIRTHKALQHMERELQLPSATVMPTLLQLMKAYDGNWEFIEADNYHVLVDAIFSMQESEDEHRAPGSSSGSGRRRREKRPPTRGTSSRRGARNSKRAESDDSDEHDGAHELVRRGRGRGAIARNSASRPAASGEGAKRKAPVKPDDDEDYGTPWEPPLLALPAPLRSVPPQCQLSFPTTDGRGELRRTSTGQWVRGEVVTTRVAVSKETQTEASCFYQLDDPIPANALICYEEILPENPKETVPVLKDTTPVVNETTPAVNETAPVLKNTTPVVNETSPTVIETVRALNEARPAPVVVKQEKEPVFLSDAEARRQLLNPFHVSREICKKCEKPVVVRFDPSRVKVEGAPAPASGKNQEPPPMVCLNPEPLQVVVPSLMPARPSEPVDRVKLLDKSPQPLLLTFPPPKNSIPTVETNGPLADPGAVATSSATGSQQMQGLAPCSERPATSATGVQMVKMQELVPCSERPVIDNDCHSPVEMTCEPAVVPPVEPASEVAEDPLEAAKEVKVTEVEVKEVVRSLDTSVTRVHDDQELPSGAGCQNSTSEGALAALAGYSSESEHSDVDPLPTTREPDQLADTSSSCPKEDVRDVVPQGILPLANVSSVRELQQQSNNGTVTTTAHRTPRVESFLEPSRDSWVVVEVKQTQALSPPRTQRSSVSPPVTATAPATVDPQQSSSRPASPECSKKRKRGALVKLNAFAADEPSREDVVRRARPRHDPLDISRGKEKVAISLCAAAELLPAAFFYVTASVVYQAAHVGISMARVGEDDSCSGCVGNCLDNRVPCECARLTDGEYAYTVEGSLYPHFLKQEMERKRNLALLSYCQPGACPVERTNDEVCKGHVQRRFIKECWEKCGCMQTCGNRVVQRGVVHRLQVFWTEEGKGWGLRTLEPLRAGTFVCEYVGEILTNTEMWHRNNDVHGKARHQFSLQLDADWCSERYLKDEEALCLDGTCFGNVARFINHRCFDANLIEIPVEIENPDHHYYHLAFFTSRDVNENEELTWDYGLDFNDRDHQVRAFDCLCGSSLCRGKLEGKPWV